MLALQVFRWLLLAAALYLAAPILYLCLLSLSAILATHRRKNAASAWETGESVGVGAVQRPFQPTLVAPSFAILVPAHNEESILGTLLKSLSSLNYPPDTYTVCVVADNCTDGTAVLARATEGVRVYERYDQTLRGKGYALNWLMGQLEAEHLVYDAYVILDADSVVEPTFLSSMARELAQGARAMQANNTVLNVTASPSTALRLIAMTLVNHVRPLGRNGLGASSTLTGNGMCLSRALLLRYPWQAFSLAEDYQYYLSLVEQGERVRYVPEAIARSEMPTTFSQMRTQDIRWESADGNQTTGKVALKLLQAGLKNRDFVRIEAIAELLTPPLSLLLCGSLLLALTALFTASWFALGASLILLLGLLSYIGSALYLLRPPRAVYVALLHAPSFILWKLWVYFVLSRSNKHKGMWVRTSRS